MPMPPQTLMNPCRPFSPPTGMGEGHGAHRLRKKFIDKWRFPLGAAAPPRAHEIYRFPVNFSRAREKGRGGSGDSSPPGKMFVHPRGGKTILCLSMF